MKKTNKFEKKPSGKSGPAKSTKSTLQEIKDRRRSEKVQTTVYEISEAAHSAESLESLGQSIHKLITDLMPAKNNFYIALHKPDSDMLTFPYFIDEFEDNPGPQKIGKGLTEYVLRTGVPLLASPEVYEDLEKKGEVESVGPPSIDWLGVPLKTKDRTIGILVVQSYTEGLRYSEEEKNILVFISEQVAMAIERREAEKELKEREELFRSVVENSHNSIIIIDDTFRVIYSNDEGIQLFGYSREEVIGSDFGKFLDKESLELVEDRYIRRQRGEEIPPRYEYYIIRKDGEKRCVETSASIIKNSEEKIQTVAQLVDITERKNAEKQLLTALKEKEVLLQEIHHRVKNNLQIITSLLNLQSRLLKDKQAIEMFEVSKTRIRSMALVHEKLHLSKDLNKVDFFSYVKSLVSQLIGIYGIDSSMIDIVVNAAEIFLDINTAIPCGLIVNELVSNSLKYAFSESGNGKILIDIRSYKDNRFKLIVQDDGIGLPEHLDVFNTESLGLQLVVMLTEQLQGSMKQKKQKGTSFEIEFREI